MKISIIGAGHIGGALAKGLDNKGHEVTIGTRDIANTAVLELVKNGKQISADPYQMLFRVPR